MDYLEVAGVVTGLLYLWFEYRVSIWLWPTGIVMPALYIVIYDRAGLYADSWINVYFLLAGIYGWFRWAKKNREASEGERAEAVRFAGNRVCWMLLPWLIALWAALCFVLLVYTDSTVPVFDSFTTALSVVALWMLSRKYVEQWLAWLVVDVVSGSLYMYKGLYLTAGLYFLYAFIAYWGYLRWRKLAGSNEIWTTQ